MYDKPSRPCSDPAIAAILECHQDGYCLGKVRWEKRPHAHGELRKAANVRRCPYVDACRLWWRQHPELTQHVQR